MADNKQILHVKSDQTGSDGISPKLPTSEQLEHGEIAINYLKDKETFSIKNSANEIVSFNKEVHVGTTEDPSIVAKLPQIFIDENADTTDALNGVGIYSIEQVDALLDELRNRISELESQVYIPG